MLTLIDLYNNHRRDVYYYHHFIDKGTEAQRGIVTLPKAHSQEKVKFA